jgi:CRISPR-associated protein (TIGR02710 family)
MSRKILICTVGGSHQPIIASIKNHQPDFIYFICSADDKETKQVGSRNTVDGDGLVCGYPKLNEYSIVKQCGLSTDKYDVEEFLDIDNLDACFTVSLNIIKKVNKKFGDSKIICDYTAGTKSMSSGLVLASVHFDNAKISIIKGLRSNLQKTINRTEFSSAVNSDSILVERKLDDLKYLLEHYDYASAIVIIKGIFNKYPNIDKTLQSKFRNALNICLAFDSWDKFAHNESHEMIQFFSKELLDYKFLIESVISERKFIDNNFENNSVNVKITNFELVQDIILNAERRAVQGRFDDAVARLYRALELFAQLYLKKYFSIETGNLDLSKVPEELKQKYHNTKIGLMEAYELITNLDTERLGKSFMQYKGKVLHKLEVRNQSILAHGFTPITETDYKEVYEIFAGFMKNNIDNLKDKKRKSIKVEQFPKDLLSLAGLE